VRDETDMLSEADVP